MVTVSESRFFFGNDRCSDIEMSLGIACLFGNKFQITDIQLVNKPQPRVYGCKVKERRESSLVESASVRVIILRKNDGAHCERI